MTIFLASAFLGLYSFLKAVPVVIRQIISGTDPGAIRSQEYFFLVLDQSRVVGLNGFVLNFSVSSSISRRLNFIFSLPQSSLDPLSPSFSSSLSSSLFFHRQGILALHNFHYQCSLYLRFHGHHGHSLHTINYA